jgi:hypothetical protein
MSTTTRQLRWLATAATALVAGLPAAPKDVNRCSPARVTSVAFFLTVTGILLTVIGHLAGRPFCR